MLIRMKAAIGVFAGLVLASLLLAVAHAQMFCMCQVGIGPPAPTMRSTLNLNFLDTADYNFIDLFAQGSSSGGVALGSGTVTSALLDASGYPCTNQVNTNCPDSASTNPIGPGTGGIMDFSAMVPANTTATPNYTGYYCLQGYGSGKFQLFGSGTWTIQSAGTTTCAAFNGSASNCTSANVSAGSVTTVTDDTWSGWCVALTYSGVRQPGDQGKMIEFSSDDLNSNGHYLKGIHLYQQTDGSDYASGCTGTPADAYGPANGCRFRHAWKQQLVNNDYGAIRFLNWYAWGTGGRFEDRPTPINQPYPGNSNHRAGYLPYAPATRSGNVYTIAGVTGTPTSMKHGEQAIFVAPSAGPTGSTGINSFSVAGTTVTMQVASTSGFTTGDVMLPYGNGAKTPQGNLWYFPVTVTIDSGTQLHFTFANAASLTNCPSSCGNIAEYATLQVGSGSDRTAYPIYDSNGENPIPGDSNVIPVNTYSKYCFSKTLGGTTDGSGNWSYGAWWNCEFDIVPIELMTELINELNAMSPTHPINMWLNLEAQGIVCSSFYSDPDCSSASDYPLNTAKTVINGANGYAGLCSQCQLILEHANETWNSAQGVSNLLAHYYTLPAAPGKIGCGGATDNVGGPSTMLSELAINDVQSVYPLGGSRVKYTLGGQAGFPAGPGGTGRITVPLAGNGCVPVGPTGSSAPITLYDYFNIASYIDLDFVNPPVSTWEANWASDVNSFGFSSSQAQADLKNATDNMFNGVGNTGSISALETFYGDYISAISPYNKYILSYEGGWDNAQGFGWITSISCTSGTVTINASATNFASTMVINNVSVAGYNGVFSATGNAGTFTYTPSGGCPVGTPTTDFQGYYGFVTTLGDGFLWYAKTSSNWATRVSNWLTWYSAQSNVGMPDIDYIQTDFRWGLTAPDTFGATNTEGGGNAPAWTTIGNFNQAQPN